MGHELAKQAPLLWPAASIFLLRVTGQASVSVVGEHSGYQHYLVLALQIRKLRTGILQTVPHQFLLVSCSYLPVV